MGVVIQMPLMVRERLIENPPNRIREWRKRRGLTQAELGGAWNTSASQFGRFETGEREVDLFWLRRIAQTLECRVVDLLNDVDVGISDPRDRTVYEALAHGGIPAETLRATATALMGPAPAPIERPARVIEQDNIREAG